MELTGRLYQLFETETGISSFGSWKRQDFLLETSGDQIRKVFMSNWNDKIDLSHFNIGDEIRVDIQIESKEFKERWFTSIKALRMELFQKSTIESIKSLPEKPLIDKTGIDITEFDEGDLPF